MNYVAATFWDNFVIVYFPKNKSIPLNGKTERKEERAGVKTTQECFHFRYLSFFSDGFFQKVKMI